MMERFIAGTPRCGFESNVRDSTGRFAARTLASAPLRALGKGPPPAPPCALHPERVRPARYRAQPAKRGAVVEDTKNAEVRDRAGRLEQANLKLRGLILELARDKGEALRRLREVSADAPGAQDASSPAQAALAPTAPEAAGPGTEAIPLLGDGSSRSPFQTPPQATELPPPPAPSRAVLRELVRAASAADARVFSYPAQPLVPGTHVRLYYDRRGSALAQRAPVLKLGWNGWEALERVAMRALEKGGGGSDGERDGGGAAAPDWSFLGEGDWFEARFRLPELLSRADFVLFDPESGAHDNNGGRNYALALRGAMTPEALAAARASQAEALQAWLRGEVEAEERRRGEEEERRIKMMEGGGERSIGKAGVAEAAEAASSSASPAISASPTSSSAPSSLSSDASGAPSLPNSQTLKARLRAKAARARRAEQARVMILRPPRPLPGQEVEVYYNPDATPLKGRPEVWMQATFECCAPGADAQRSFMARDMVVRRPPPVPMAQAVPGGVGFRVAKLRLPADALGATLAFCDSQQGSSAGFTDDQHGRGWRLELADANGGAAAASAEPRPALRLRVVHAAVEMAPIAKAGGLGDVVTALGRAVQDEGHDVEVVLPKHDCIDYGQVADFGPVAEIALPDGTPVGVWRGCVEGLRTTFLEPRDGSFAVGRIYTDERADRGRFARFAEAAAAWLRWGEASGAAPAPDVVHCHDWQAAPLGWGELPAATARVFTIHNLNYGADWIGRAMAAADAATTVSPTYALEVSGHPALAPHHAKFGGVRNGIDTEIWDPETDRSLARGYGAADAGEGKRAARAALRQRLGLQARGEEGGPPEVPLVAVVSRLTHQKGIHLIRHAAWRTMERGGQFVLLGSAPDPRVQAEFDALARELGARFPGGACLYFAYDEPLSHQVYAAADLILVPSIFEPCGLTQMIGMRYGAVPVVRATGGLKDTVFDLDHDTERARAAGHEPNGFVFEGTDAPGVDYALNRALSLWYTDRAAWDALVARVMAIDWSWATPALDYIELYKQVVRQKRAAR